jgi:hypothetical protein
MLSDPVFWAGVIAGGVAGIITGAIIGIRLYLRTGKW